MKLDWQKSALCRGADNEIFFPINMKPTRFNEAIEICLRCAVKDQCLNFALSFDEQDDKWGVYGGLTPNQRGRLRDQKILRNV